MKTERVVKAFSALVLVFSVALVGWAVRAKVRLDRDYHAALAARYRPAPSSTPVCPPNPVCPANPGCPPVADPCPLIRAQLRDTLSGLDWCLDDRILLRRRYQECLGMEPAAPLPPSVLRRTGHGTAPSP